MPFLFKINPTKFFLVVSLVTGVFMLLITPPFQMPDEVNHFYKSYQIADGKLLSESYDGRLGGYVPKSFVKITKPFEGLKFKMHTKTDFETIREQLAVSLNEDTKVFVDYPNTALYSPISYIPQTFSIFILTKFNLPPLIIFYLARLFTLLIWIACIGLAIKITPIYKWLFTLLALLPMSIFTHASLSADVVTDIFAFLLVATIFKIAFQEEKFDLYKYLTIVGLTVMLASAKLVYTPLVFLFAIIPVEKFKSTRNFLSHFSLLLIIGFGTAFLWSKSINGLYTPYCDYNPAFRDGLDLINGAHLHQQLDFIIHNIGFVIIVFLKSVYHAFDMYYQGYIGTFGWLDTKLPFWTIHIGYVVIAFSALFENNKRMGFTLTHKAIILCSVVAMISLIMLSQYLTWVAVGNEKMRILQGRYFIPVFPLLFMLLNNSRFNRQNLVSAAVILFSIFILSLSAWTIYSRYYVAPTFETTTIVCDAEGLSEEKSFTTSIPGVLLDNGDTQSDEMSRSALKSAKLFSGQAKGFSYSFFDGEMGDVIDIEVWRYGKSGGIVFDLKPNEDWNYFTSEVLETDENGWDRLHLTYTFISNRSSEKNIIYIYNNESDTSYFDDLSISIHKQK
ncbi:MAG: DUF2142 domain-containing protein [Bacteroidales bacterium]|nr:DUF2142 domain-containing protein [Bacteroidales bacterium]MCF8455146.1 DUF2142 domain-containing protein [Bacteroidales bacterium]